MMRRRALVSACVGSAVAALAGWEPIPARAQAGMLIRSEKLASGQRLYAGADRAFGTAITAKVLHTDQRQAELAIEDALHAAKKIDALMSIHREDSQVFRLNRVGWLDRPDAHLRRVLEEARRLSQLTGGAFDITVQPLWEKFSRAAAVHCLPSREERQAARSLVNWRELRLEKDQVSFGQPGMAITLNGLAQGYAADLALAAVRARGVEHALLDTGEFISRGVRTLGHGWALGVRHPRQADGYTAVLRMDGRSVATSGDYETSFTPDFVHHHIFDPATADSPLALASVTVVAPTGLLADGLSTALFVMGPDKALALAAQLDKVDVLLVDKKGKTWKTPGLQELHELRA